MHLETKTCKTLSTEAFHELVDSLYEDSVFIDISLDGIYVGHSEEELPIEDLHEKLAEALNVDEVTSIHADDYEPPLVWIVYRNRKAERTNFQMLKSIEEFYPEKYGVLSESEEAYLREALSIAGRDIISLQNLRDFAVMFYALQDDAAEASPEMIMDKMSAICAVIDDRLFALGAETQGKEKTMQRHKIKCPCCGFELANLSPDETKETFWCPACNMDIDIATDTDTPVMICNDRTMVEWVNIGEGICGDYDPDDPDDINMLRYDVSWLPEGSDHWEEVEDASYVTCVSADTDSETLTRLCYILFKEYDNAMDAYPECSVKKLGERLSHISPGSLAK